MTRIERESWGQIVAQQIQKQIPQDAQIVFLAGVDYREPVLRHLKIPYSIDVPMEGMGIGQQMRWLLDNT